MTRIYQYVGPRHILEDTSTYPPGHPVSSQEDVRAWLRGGSAQVDADGWVTATFTVSLAHQFTIADRRSEHVACAGGGPVLAAGEVTFEVGEHVEVVDISNQSTGFCPEPACWEATRVALERAHIAHPGDFTRAFTFRLCPACGQRNLVKEQWFECALCSADLPRAWNFQ